MILIPITSPKLPPICDRKSKNDIRFSVTYFIIFFSLKKTFMIPMSCSNASYVGFFVNSEVKIKSSSVFLPFMAFLLSVNLATVEEVSKYHGTVWFAFWYSFCALSTQGAGLITPYKIT